MAGTVLKALVVSLLLAVFLLGSLHASEISGSDGDEEQQVYIVYLGHQHEPSDLPGGFSAAEASHHGMLSQILDDDGSSATDRIVYSYKRSINGFAARLTEQEKQKLSSMEGVWCPCSRACR